MNRISVPRVVFITVAAFLLMAAAGLAYVRTHSLHPGTNEYQAVMAAAKAYGEQQEARGLPVPESITLQELAEEGLIPESVSRSFAGLEVTVSLRGEEGTPFLGPLMRVRFADGHEVVALNDGSVQQLKK